MDHNSKKAVMQNPIFLAYKDHPEEVAEFEGHINALLKEKANRAHAAAPEFTDHPAPNAPMNRAPEIPEEVLTPTTLGAAITQDQSAALLREKIRNEKERAPEIAAPTVAPNVSGAEMEASRAKIDQKNDEAAR